MIEPLWLTDALKAFDGQDRSEMKKAAWSGMADVVFRNAEGLVVRAYDVGSDTSCWQFGNASWSWLIDPKTGMRFADDPFLDRQDNIPLTEFIAYLNDWYYDRHNKGRRAI